MAFTLNDPIIGRAPDISWLCLNGLSFFARSCESIIRTVEKIPPTLLSEFTVLCLDLHAWVQQIEGCELNEEQLLLLREYLHAVVYGASIGKIVLSIDPGLVPRKCIWSAGIFYHCENPDAYLAGFPHG